MSWGEIIRLLFCLQTLSIRGKTIRRFHSDAFLGLHVLKTLKLKYCNINVTPPLDPTKYTLEMLSLQANDLVYIEASYFMGFRRLATVNLSFNRLSTIPNITPLAGILLSFDIAHNSVLSLKPFLFNVCFTNLRYLYVSNNKIRELTSDLMPQWLRLRLLKIENNLLETLQDLSCITRESLSKVMTRN